MDRLSEKCGVFGVYLPGQDAARLTFYGLMALQHRGQESSGMVSSEGRELRRHSGAGLVATVYRESDLAGLPGYIAIGHNRYSTSGGTDGAHIQPVMGRRANIALAHNGNLPVTQAMDTFLTTKGTDHHGWNDSEMMTEVIADHVRSGLTLDEAVKQSFALFQGAFSVVAMDATSLVAFRDSCGIRPLSLGKLEDGYVIASETCALDTVGATFVRDIEPGELIVIDQNGLRSRRLAASTPKLDIFELVYFARPDSLLLGQSVNTVREKLGRYLAKETNILADVVIPVPDSAIPAALGYSRQSGVQFEMGLIKNRYIHRTFIRPTAALRERDLHMKLNPIPDLIRDKRVVLVDDSIVRGTTLKKIVAIVRAAGAREVHVLISSPPVKFPDFYGINTPKQSELIAASKSEDEIGRTMGADSLHYLSFSNLMKATGVAPELFCVSCFTGDYPIDIGERRGELTGLPK